MDKISVSILVPVYNTSLYLRECLDTLIGQTLKEIEIVCVNDGSTDNSLEILEEYAAKDSRIVIVNKENGGLPSARNAGLDRARGEYVGFVDSDDFVDTKMFETLYRTAIKKSSEIVVCGGKLYPLNATPEGWVRPALATRNCHYPSFTPRILFKERASRPFLWRMLIKRELFEREHIRLPENIVLGEDNALQYRLYPRAKGVTFISKKLYHYRCERSDSTMATANGARRSFFPKVEKHTLLCSFVFDELKKLPDYLSMSRDAIFWSEDLIYEDFIKLSQKERHLIAKKLTAKWNEFGYWGCHNTYDPITANRFRYYYQMAELIPEEDVDISFIIDLKSDHAHFPGFINSLNAQSEKNTEIILINHDYSNDKYLTELMLADPRIRVMNFIDKTPAYAYTSAVCSASGRAIVFANMHSTFSEKNVLSDYFTALTESGADVVASKHQLCSTKGKEISDYRSEELMFSREYISQEKFEFSDDYGPLCKDVFVNAAVAAADKISAAKTEHSIFGTRDSRYGEVLSRDEANAILRGYLEMLRVTRDSGMKKEHRRLVFELNSDEVTGKIIAATTSPVIHGQGCLPADVNEGESFALIVQLNSAVCREFLDGGSYPFLRMLGEFALERDTVLLRSKLKRKLKP